MSTSAEVLHSCDSHCISSYSWLTTEKWDSGDSQHSNRHGWLTTEKHQMTVTVSTVTAMADWPQTSVRWWWFRTVTGMADRPQRSETVVTQRSTSHGWLTTEKRRMMVTVSTVIVMVDWRWPSRSDSHHINSYVQLTDYGGVRQWWLSTVTAMADWPQSCIRWSWLLAQSLLTDPEKYEMMVTHSTVIAVVDWHGEAWEGGLAHRSNGCI